MSTRRCASREPELPWHRTHSTQLKMGAAQLPHHIGGVWKAVDEDGPEV